MIQDGILSSKLSSPPCMEDKSSEVLYSNWRVRKVKLSVGMRGYLVYIIYWRNRNSKLCLIISKGLVNNPAKKPVNPRGHIWLGSTLGMWKGYHLILVTKTWKKCSILKVKKILKRLVLEKWETPVAERAALRINQSQEGISTYLHPPVMFPS